jgi:hypothetical protein
MTLILLVGYLLIGAYLTWYFREGFPEEARDATHLRAMVLVSFLLWPIITILYFAAKVMDKKKS